IVDIFLVDQGWRSVSFVFGRYSHVVFAQNAAPSFLKSNEGQTKNEWGGVNIWEDLYSFCE
ncbi:MAG: DUF1780 domain-containing protein, partial [Deltaproteobacteria bacterium]|nr:DUF1780 domain-containing protein [Deltaproteobacteria bacterium]